jgi:uncharacterized HhH-GPD family protein
MVNQEHAGQSPLYAFAVLQLSGDPEADRLLSEDPFALLIGMVLDQQVPLERAFSSPRDLKERLGGKLDAAEIASMDPAKLASIFSERPALHRFPASNAERVQQLSRIIVEDYEGDAARIWDGATTGTELLRRVKALPGFGEQKAKIFVALLGKQLDVRPRGWQEVSRPFGDPGTTFSVADITDAGSLARVRAYKSQAKAAAKAAKAGTAS